MTTSTRQIISSTARTISAAGGGALLWPPNNVETVGAKAVEWMLWLTEITGSPTAAKLEAVYQKAIAHTTWYEFTSPAWADFTDDDVADRCLGGKAWGYQAPSGTPDYSRATTKAPGVLHDSSVAGSMTLGYMVTGRVTAPYDMNRVRLIPTFTGGTDPAYHVTGLWTITY